MIVTCERCGRGYDDEHRWTICPHRHIGGPFDAPFHDPPVWEVRLADLDHMLAHLEARMRRDSEAYWRSFDASYHAHIGPEHVEGSWEERPVLEYPEGVTFGTFVPFVTHLVAFALGVAMMALVMCVQP